MDVLDEGLTVRALHHYDHVGLLRPSARSGAGHRLHTATDLTRLYRITLLRRLGFPLAEIGHMLDDPDWQIDVAITAHRRDTERRTTIAARLRDRLAEMSAELERNATGQVRHAELRAGDQTIWLHRAGDRYKSPQ